MGDSRGRVGRSILIDIVHFIKTEMYEYSFDESILSNLSVVSMFSATPQSMTSLPRNSAVEKAIVRQQRLV